MYTDCALDNSSQLNFIFVTMPDLEPSLEKFGYGAAASYYSYVCGL